MDAGVRRRAGHRGAATAAGLGRVLARRTAATARILEGAGFDGIHFEDVNEPVLYGHDLDVALAVVRGFQDRRAPSRASTTRGGALRRASARDPRGALQRRARRGARFALVADHRPAARVPASELTGTPPRAAHRRTMPAMGWTMFYLFVFLKLPIFALGYIVWWAVKQETDTMDVPADGGSPRPRRPHPRPRRPRPPTAWRPARRCAPAIPAAHPLGDGRRPRPRTASVAFRPCLCPCCPTGRSAPWSRPGGSSSRPGSLSSSSRRRSTCAWAHVPRVSQPPRPDRSACGPPEGLTEQVEIAATAFVIHPGEFCLGRTAEWVELPDDLVARIEGKSSLGRLGLIVHATAGFSTRAGRAR